MLQEDSGKIQVSYVYFSKQDNFGTSTETTEESSNEVAQLVLPKGSKS